MKKKMSVYLLLSSMVIIVLFAFNNNNTYSEYFEYKVQEFEEQQSSLIKLINNGEFDKEHLANIKRKIDSSRIYMKGFDFWSRYLDPNAYRSINSPLLVEWESEAYDKSDPPQYRQGAGLSLAELYLDEEDKKKEKLLALLKPSTNIKKNYLSAQVKDQLQKPDHFFLCNRLFLMNLAAIYSTGFECPDTSRVITELKSMLISTQKIYQLFNENFSATQLSQNYMNLFGNTIAFVSKQPDNFTEFDHFTFIKNYINPLFKMNQGYIQEYNVITNSFQDYTINNSSQSLFDKSLYFAQNSKGIFLRVKNSEDLKEMDRLGKLLFYDPILSGNNRRSCVSCHKPSEFFTDTLRATPLQFNDKIGLERNAPTLLNATHNFEIMLDGAHLSMQNQAKAVISNSQEMGGFDEEVVEKVLSCPEYKNAFKKLLKYTPHESKVISEHITSVITYYYGKFSTSYSPFDQAIEGSYQLTEKAKKGFSLFMGKARCATCHFVPQFNGVKPPFISSEFEVIGVPADSLYKKLSPDLGRFTVNPSTETRNAFRTGSLRNIEHTKPYMHNGVFTSLDQVIDFYDAGGGIGKGLNVKNQTLSPDSLRLTQTEKSNLLAFLKSLNEKVNFEPPPTKLPQSNNLRLNKRKVGGDY